MTITQNESIPFQTTIPSHLGGHLERETRHFLEFAALDIEADYRRTADFSAGQVAHLSALFLLAHLLSFLPIMSRFSLTSILYPNMNKITFIQRRCYDESSTVRWFTTAWDRLERGSILWRLRQNKKIGFASLCAIFSHTRLHTQSLILLSSFPLSLSI